MRLNKLWSIGLAAMICLGLGASSQLIAADAQTKTGYLFAYFINNGEDGLHLAWSTDGLTWTALNGGKSYIQPKVGESKLMRDPYLMYCPDGMFRMVWTSAWEGVTIGYASSKDLINWSDQVAIPVGAADKTHNCWAPEMSYDSAKKQYVIFWSSTIDGRFTETIGGGDLNNRTYYTTTRDFRSFEPTKLFFEPGYNCIDPTMTKYAGNYYLVFKDERKKPVAYKNLRTAVGPSPIGPWKNISEPFSEHWVEGPSTLKVGDEYIVYFDKFTRGGYGAMKTKDLKTWVDVSTQLSMPKGVKHGSALVVPMSVIDNLKALTP